MYRGVIKIIAYLHLYLFTGYLCAQNTQISLVNQESGEPVQFANVCWQLSGGEKELKGNSVSDSEGKVLIPVREGETIILSVTCIGYKSIYDTINLANNRIINVKEDIFNLEQVTITGTRTPHTLKNAPVLTQMITRKEIERTDAVTITNILEAEVPGIELSRHGYGQSMTVQGLQPQYTLILVDGERMAGETGGNIDYSRINAANIEKVEIVRGAGSALYGSNAIGGVINIITKKPRKKIDISTSLRFAQYNQKNYDPDKFYDEDYEYKYYKNQDWPNLNGNVAIGFRNKKLYSSTYLNFKSSDGYELTDQERLVKQYRSLDTTVIEPIGTASINGLMDYTISQKAGYDGGENWTFELRGNYYQHEEFKVGAHNWLHDLFRNYTLGGFTEFKINEDDAIRLSYNSDLYEKYDVYERKSDSAALNYSNGFQNVKLNYAGKPGERHNLFAGIENLYEILKSDMFIYDASQVISKPSNDIVMVLQDEFNITTRFLIIAGIRGGYHSNFKYHASPSLSIKYNMNPVNLRFSYARGYRSPSLKELYMNWDHLGMFQLLGNADLKAETNDYMAMSADYINTDKVLNATLISSYNQVHDKIDGIWTSDSTVNYINFDQVKVFNVEVIVKWRFHRFFNAKGGYVFTHLKKDEDVIALSEVSPHAFTSQLEYFFSREKYHLSINLAGKFFGKKKSGSIDFGDHFVFERFEINYPAYFLGNFTINQQYGQHFIFNTGIKNLFNYKAPTVTMNTSPSIGRKFFVSLGYRF